MSVFYAVWFMTLRHWTQWIWHSKTDDNGYRFLAMKVVVHRLFATIVAQLALIRLAENVFIRAEAEFLHQSRNWFLRAFSNNSKHFDFMTLWNYFFLILTDAKLAFSANQNFSNKGIKQAINSQRVILIGYFDRLLACSTAYYGVLSATEGWFYLLD